MKIPSYIQQWKTGLAAVNRDQGTALSQIIIYCDIYICCNLPQLRGSRGSDYRNLSFSATNTRFETDTVETEFTHSCALNQPCVDVCRNRQNLICGF